MPTERARVGLVVERRKLDNPWVDYAWAPLQVFPEAPATAAWTEIGRTQSAVRYYAGAVEMTLHSTETGNYSENLELEQPRLWVALAVDSGEPPIEIVAVTGDPAEGEALTETGTYVVDTVPMPPEIAAWMARFVAEHHVERPFLKRRRDRAEPDVIHRGRPREDE
jgi:hypothetical protein